MLDVLKVTGPVDEGAGYRQRPFGVVRREEVGPVVRRTGVQADAVHVDVPGEAVDDVAVPVVHPGLAAADQPDAGVEPLERRGPSPGLGHVLRRSAPTVHLVAEAPVPDAVGFGVSVGTPAAGPVAITAAVAVLHPGQRLVQGAGVHVEAEYRLDRGDRAPGQEASGAEAAGLFAARGGVQRPADVSYAQVANGREHVGAENHRRFLGDEAALDAASQVLGDAAEYPPVDGTDGPGGQHVDMGHRRSFRTTRLLPSRPRLNRKG